MHVLLNYLALAGVLIACWLCCVRIFMSCSHAWRWPMWSVKPCYSTLWGMVTAFLVL